MISRVSRGVALVTAATVMVVAAMAMFRPTADADEVDVAADYHEAVWPDDMTWLCIEDETHGFPVREATAEYADFVDMQVHEQCPDGAYTVTVSVINDPDAETVGRMKSPKDEDGTRSTAAVTLNVAFAYRMDPRKWRMLLIHELGHVVGLRHTYEYDSVMHPGGELFRLDGLTETDRRQLTEIYHG